jgi:hypothetical protein
MADNEDPWMTTDEVAEFLHLNRRTSELADVDPPSPGRTCRTTAGGAVRPPAEVKVFQDATLRWRRPTGPLPPGSLRGRRLRLAVAAAVAFAGRRDLAVGPPVRLASWTPWRVSLRCRSCVSALAADVAFGSSPGIVQSGLATTHSMSPPTGRAASAPDP